MAAFSWNIPAAANYTIGTNTPDDWLAAINAHFVANSGGGSAVWEVATYQSTSPRYIILRRKSLAAGRIIIFGQQGSTPNAAAVRATAAASRLYIGYSKTSTATTEDASYLSAAPLSASDYMEGVTIVPNTASITGRFTYAEALCGVHLLFSNTANGISIGSAGEIVADASGADVSAILGNGNNWATNWSTSTAASGALIPHGAAGGTNVDSGYGATNPGMLCRIGSANHLAFRLFMILNTVSATDLLDTGSLRAWFFPIAIIGNATYLADGIIGKLKQMAFGPPCLRETTWLLASTGLRNAWGFGYDTSVQINGLWFTEFEV